MHDLAFGSEYELKAASNVFIFLSSTSSFPVLFFVFALVIGDKMDPHSYAASEM